MDAKTQLTHSNRCSYCRSSGPAQSENEDEETGLLAFDMFVRTFGLDKLLIL